MSLQNSCLKIFQIVNEKVSHLKRDFSEACVKHFVTDIFTFFAVEGCSTVIIVPICWQRNAALLRFTCQSQRSQKVGHKVDFVSVF